MFKIGKQYFLYNNVDCTHNVTLNGLVLFYQCILENKVKCPKLRQEETIFKIIFMKYHNGLGIILSLRPK